MPPFLCRVTRLDERGLLKFGKQTTQLWVVSRETLAVRVKMLR